MLKLKAVEDFTYQGLTVQKGSTIEVDDAIGRQLVSLEHATLVDEPKAEAVEAEEPVAEWLNDDLRAYLDKQVPPVEYPSDANKDDLVKLVRAAKRKEARSAKE